MNQRLQHLFRAIDRVSIGFLIIGIMFRIMHWPAAKPILFAAIMAPIVAACFRFGFTRPKERKDFIRLCLVISAATYFGLRVFHWPGKFIALAALLISFAAWILEDPDGYFGIRSKKNSTLRVKLASLAFGLGAMATLIGVFFVILHYPGGKIIVISGIALLAFSFFNGILKE